MIQAKSLSGVIRLADDPPASPHSAQETLDPLVLYIARVPGNRGRATYQIGFGLKRLTGCVDVFLTTTKPLQKIVTAQDVQSSLYYVHLDSQDDDRLRETIESSHPDANQSLTAEEEVPIDSRAGSTFKGLPPAAPRGMKSPLESSLPALDSPQASLPDPSRPTTIVRKPVGQGSPPKFQAALSRLKPSGAEIMGPRAMYPRLHSVDSPGLRPAHGKENLMPRRWSDQPPIALPPSPLKTAAPRPSAAAGRDPTAPYSDTARSQIPNLPGVSAEPYLNERRQSFMPTAEDHSLTLIRRYDGSQWNVGKVFNACRPENHTAKYASSQPDDIAIQISTPGYAKYQSSSHFNESVPYPQVFERRLLQPRRRSDDKTLVENSPGVTDHKKRMSIDFRKLSKPHRDKTTSQSERGKRSPEGRSTGIKGYAFYSPWNGTCEFSSGVTGQTLKCKHTPPEPGSQAVTVSELRFNLPTSNGLGIASPSVPRSPEGTRSSKRGSCLSSKRGSESTYSEASDQFLYNNEDEEEQFDLSLGQERAGGGFGGKQAKLSKLIVEPEGLKMLDLVVAANMGLWWRVYERPA